MTSIIWYICNEYLKKERELAEKAQEKVRKQVDRLRNGDNAGTGDGQKRDNDERSADQSTAFLKFSNPTRSIVPPRRSGAFPFSR